MCGKSGGIVLRGFGPFLVGFCFAQTNMSWHSLVTLRYSREPLRIKVQSRPVLQ